MTRYAQESRHLYLSGGGFVELAARLRPKRATLFRRLGRGARRVPRLVSGCLLLHPADRPDRGLIQRQQRHSERKLAEHVRRGENCSDYERADNEVAALGLELVGRDDSHPAKKRHNDRQLEGNTEGEYQLHHQGEVVLHLGQELDCGLSRSRRLLHAQREASQHRPDQKVDDKRAEHEENRSGHQVRQECLPLVPIKTRRNEHVDLRRNYRKRNESSPEHSELQLDYEIFEQSRIDEFCVLRASYPHEGPSENVVNGLREEKAPDKGDTKRNECLDQPRAQLDQVIHQRRLGRLDVLVRHVALPCASCVPGLVSSEGACTVAPSGAAIFGAADDTSAGTGSAELVMLEARFSATDCGAAFSAVGFSAIALSIWDCVFSSSRRTSLTGSKLP